MTSSLHSGWEKVVKAERERLGMDKPKVEGSPSFADVRAPKPAQTDIEDNVVAIKKPKRIPKKAPK